MIEDSLEYINSQEISNSQKEYIVVLLARYFNRYQYSNLPKNQQINSQISEENSSLSLSIQLLLKIEEQGQLKGLLLYRELLLFFSEIGKIKESQFILSAFLSFLKKEKVNAQGENSLESSITDIEKLYHPILLFYSKQKNVDAASDLLQTIIENSRKSFSNSFRGKREGNLTPYFNQVLEILCESSEIYRAKQLFLVKDFRIIPNGRTFQILIDSCNSSNDLDDILQIMFACSFNYNQSTWNALITVCYFTIKINKTLGISQNGRFTCCHSSSSRLSKSNFFSLQIYGKIYD